MEFKKFYPGIIKEVKLYLQIKFKGVERIIDN